MSNSKNTSQEVYSWLKDHFTEISTKAVGKIFGSVGYDLFRLTQLDESEEESEGRLAAGGLPSWPIMYVPCDRYRAWILEHQEDVEAQGFEIYQDMSDEENLDGIVILGLEAGNGADVLMNCFRPLQEILTKTV